MKFPQHIILDIIKDFTKFSAQLWFPKYLTDYRIFNLISKRFSFHKKFLFNTRFIKLNKLIKSQKKFTIKYSKFWFIMYANEFIINYVKTTLETREKVKHRDNLSKHWVQEFNNFLKNPCLRYDERSIMRLIRSFKNPVNVENYKSDKLWNIFNIYFLKKEKIYTKLKYSRVPQYDIVSGGSAALFAGFLGFLICEKYGFELADSGDFYYLFMYVVILCFSLRIFLKIMNAEERDWHIFSFKWLVYFLESASFNVTSFLTSLRRTAVSKFFLTN